MRVHGLLDLLNQCPLKLQAEDAWRTIYDHVCAFRSDMLWLNEHAHFSGAQAPAPNRADGTPEIDVSDALRDRAKNKRKSLKKAQEVAGAICHMK